METSSISSQNMPVDNINYVKFPKSDDSRPDNNKQVREIGDLAVWTLSSAKQGHGVGK